LEAQTRQKKSVAAVVTVYTRNSHADVLVGKILEGWRQDGGPGPALSLASLYVDQFPKGDLSRSLSKKYRFPIFDSIEKTLTLGTDRIAVDGVLSIGEHGDYPWNDLGQHLYPRRRFFEQITDAFQKYAKVVPVFSDKHPGPAWPDAKWMYDRGKELHLPWMAGSSLPVSFRDPDVAPAWGCDLEACMAVGYSGLDVYGFHTMDFLQTIVERRARAELGVSSVQAFDLESIDKLLEDGTIRRDLLEAALERSHSDRQAWDSLPIPETAIFVIQYADGLRVPILMLNDRARAITVAYQTRGGPAIATRAEERPEPRYPHFAYLLKGIETMIWTGQPTYPVERTLLSAGLLDRFLVCRKNPGMPRLTPELAIAYKPVDYPHAPHIDLDRFEPRVFP
jgi:hypothetical protein